MTTPAASPWPGEPLLPCPFCGNTSLRLFCRPDDVGTGPSHGVQCGGDECAISGPERSTQTEAIEAWNRRTSADLATTARQAEAAAREAADFDFEIAAAIRALPLPTDALALVIAEARDDLSAGNGPDADLTRGAIEAISEVLAQAGYKRGGFIDDDVAQALHFVIRREREACAKVAESRPELVAGTIAAAIRARGDGSAS